MLPVNSGGHTAYQNLLLIIFVNIILTRMLFLVLPGISLNVSGILIFPIQTNYFAANILFLPLNQELLPVCGLPYAA